MVGGGGRRRVGGENRGRAGEETVTALLLSQKQLKIRNRKRFANACAESTHWQGFSDWTQRESAEGPDGILEQACVPNEEHLWEWEVGMGD